MEPNRTKLNYYQRIARNIVGEMSWLEEQWFRLMLIGNPQMKKLAKEMREDWSVTGESVNHKSFNANKAWSNLYQRLESDSLIPEKENSNVILFKPYSYLKYAALVLFAVIFAGVGFYKYYNPELVAIFNSSPENTFITTLSDGTTIYLAQGSTLTYPKRFVGDNRKVKLDGEAFFDVAKNPKKPFLIDTKAASVKVLGTSFNLKSTNSKNFELSVVEGKVGVNLNSNVSENIVAIAGEKVLAKNDRLVRESFLSSQSIQSTMVRLQFQDESLINIISVINKTYGASIQLSGETLKTKRISVTFENDLGSIVNILSVSFNLEMIRQPDSTIILKERDN